MCILESLGFHSTFIKTLHVDSKPFYELLRDDVPFKWTREHEKLFQNIKDRKSGETFPAVPNPKYLFHIHVDSSIGTGSILVQKLSILVLRISLTKADTKFNNLFTTTALLMMEMTIFIPLFADIWVKQRHFTLKMKVLT